MPEIGKGDDMNKRRWLLLGILVLGTLLFSACGETKSTLNVYNWGAYMDESVLEEFEQEFDCKVNYETFQTNEEMYAKIKNGGTNYDILIPSDYMIEKMIREDMLMPLDFSKIPSYQQIDSVFKNLPFDPDNTYSVPYFWGTVGIAYNTELVKEEIDSWSVLWDERYSKQFTMIDSQRDSLMVALKLLGYSMNTRNEAELEEAKNLLIEQKPLVLAYVGDNVKDMLISGETALSVVWSGEANAVKVENPSIEFVVPKEGTNLWFDSVVVPKTAHNPDLAMQFVEFLCRPEIAKRNAEFVGYSTCNVEAEKLLDPKLFPATYGQSLDDKLKTSSEVFEDPADFLKVYDKIWTELKAK